MKSLENSRYVMTCSLRACLKTPRHRSCGGAGRLASLRLSCRSPVDMLLRCASPSAPPRSQSRHRSVFKQALTHFPLGGANALRNFVISSKISTPITAKLSVCRVWRSQRNSNSARARILRQESAALSRQSMESALVFRDRG